jgi:hypothetical protein
LNSELLRDFTQNQPYFGETLLSYSQPWLLRQNLTSSSVARDAAFRAASLHAL